MGDSYKHFQGFVYASKHTRVGDTKKKSKTWGYKHMYGCWIQTHISKTWRYKKHILGLEDTNTCTQGSGIQTQISKNQWIETHKYKAWEIQAHISKVLGIQRQISKDFMIQKQTFEGLQDTNSYIHDLGDTNTYPKLDGYTNRHI